MISIKYDSSKSICSNIWSGYLGRNSKCTSPLGSRTSPGHPCIDLFLNSFVGYETLDQMNKSLHQNLVSVRTLCQRERKTLPVLARFLFRFECLLTKYIWCGYTQLCELLIYSYSLYLTIRIFYPQIKSNRFYFNSPIFLKKQLKVELIKNTYLESVEQVQQTLGPF